MLCIKLPKGRLELIFKMRRLRILEDNIGIETKRLILGNYLYCLDFFLPLSSSLLCIGKYLFEHIVFLNDLFSIIYLWRRLFKISDQKVLFLILSYHIFYIIIFKESLACGYGSLSDHLYRPNLLQGIVKLID